MSKKVNIGAFTTLISIFFFWGFVAASNDILIPVFKKALSLSQLESQLISLAFYIAYTVGSLMYFGISSFLKKDILIVNSEINQQSLNEKKKYYDSDSPFQIDDYVNKLERRKKRLEKRLNKIPLIQIKILTR